MLQLLPGAAAPSTHEEKRPSQPHKAALPELEVVGDVQVQGLGPDGAKSRSSPSGTTPEGRFAVRTVPNGGRVWVGGKESMPTAINYIQAAQSPALGEFGANSFPGLKWAEMHLTCYMFVIIYIYIYMCHHVQMVEDDGTVT